MEIEKVSKWFYVLDYSNHVKILSKQILSLIFCLKEQETSKSRVSFSNLEDLIEKLVNFGRFLFKGNFNV